MYVTETRCHPKDYGVIQEIAVGLGCVSISAIGVSKALGIIAVNWEKPSQGMDFSTALRAIGITNTQGKPTRVLG